MRLRLIRLGRDIEMSGYLEDLSRKDEHYELQTNLEQTWNKRTDTD